MLTTSQLILAFKTIYSKQSIKLSNKKRLHNITQLTSFITDEIASNNLKYGVNERRIKIYAGLNGETIFLQYPGKYSRPSTNDGTIAVPFDFRPILVDSDGNTSPDLDFQSIWKVFDDIIDSHKNCMNIISSLFFRMGRMIKYNLTCEQYNIESLCNSASISTCSDLATLDLYKVVYSDDIIESLNHAVEIIEFDNGCKVHFDAFVYFLEILLEIEDCKYYYKKNNLSSGRIQSSDSLLLFSLYYNKGIALSEMLMRFVSGRGVAKISQTEYSTATNNNIEIIDIKELLKNKLSEAKMSFDEKSINIAGTSIPTIYRIDDKKIALFDIEISDDKKNLLASKGWSYYTVLDKLENNTIDELVSILKSSPYKINICDLKKIIPTKLSDYKIKVSTSSITVNGTSISVVCRKTHEKIALVNTNLSDDKKKLLNSKGWSYYLMPEIIEYNSIDELIVHIKDILSKKTN